MPQVNEPVGDSLFPQHMRLDKEFVAYHHANPDVFALYVRFAGDVRRRGKRKYSSEAIIQRIRWHVEIDTVTDTEFKISNNHRARYARLLVQYDPTFKGWFRMKRIEGELVPGDKTFDIEFTAPPAQPSR